MTDCHTSTYGWPTTSTCATPGQLLGDAGLLRAGHEVVDEHAQPAVGVGGELLDDGDQVVDAAEVLDGDALDPQVVAPDLLDQLGVVAALDVDAARQRDPGAGVGDRARARRRARGPGRRGRRSARRARPAGPRAGSRVRAGTTLRTSWRSSSSTDAEVALDPHDLAAEAGDGLLDDQAALGDDVVGPAARRLPPVARTGRRCRNGQPCSTPSSRWWKSSSVVAGDGAAAVRIWMTVGSARSRGRRRRPSSAVRRAVGSSPARSPSATSVGVGHDEHQLAALRAVAEVHDLDVPRRRGRPPTPTLSAPPRDSCSIVVPSESVTSRGGR